MIVSEAGLQITQREIPQLATLSTQITPDSLVLSTPTKSELEITLGHEEGTLVDVQVWGDKVLAHDEGQLVSDWLSSRLNQRVRLVRFAPNQTRAVNTAWAGSSGAKVGFADVLPFHIASDRSLDELNELRAKEGLAETTMDRFRPNIVIEVDKPFKEDEIQALKLRDSNCIFELVRPCSRCTVTDTDQLSGEKDKMGNLQVLAKYRTRKNYLGKPGAMFGVQGFALNGEGHIVHVGDTLEVANSALGVTPFPRF